MKVRVNFRNLRSSIWVVSGLAFSILFSVLPAYAATFSVTNTNDSGAGSLRAAIDNANSTAGVDTVAFNISGSGVKTITIASDLPFIEDHVVIDGTTQPGFSGTPLIELNGNNEAISGLNFSLSTPTAAGSSSVKSLIINRFTSEGIYIYRSNNVSVTGCRIGTNAAGTAALSNMGNGILIWGSSNVTIGGATAASRNIISGNGADGVLIDSLPSQGIISTNNRVQGNYIGTDVTGALPLGNSFDGVHIENSSGNIVGGVEAGQTNIIAFSGFSGVYVPLQQGETTSTGNAIRNNSIFENALLGIDLAAEAEADADYGIVTANDIGDGDAGANNGQNFPVLSTPTLVSGNTAVSGTLNSRPSRSYVIDFFANNTLNLSGKGEGKTYIVSTTVTTNAGGDATFNVNLGANFGGKYITATATQTTTGAGFNDTSEFSAAVLAPGATGATVQFNTSNYGVNENDGSAIITVTRSGNTAGASSVVYTASAGTAASPADFTATTGTLQFAAGETAKTFTVTIANDNLGEDNETINLSVSSPAGASLGSPVAASLIIIDDDSAFFNIIGRITDSSGVGVSGVSVSRGAGSTPVATDANGNYFFTNVSNGTYTLTPGKSGFSFSPASRSVTVAGANVVGQNFTASAAGRSINGRVANHSGVGIANVQITRNGAFSVFTNANGDYTFQNVPPGTYTIAPVISPSLNGVTLYPPSKSVAVAGSNITNQNFSASFTINGRVANHSGTGIPNVQITRVAGASTVSVFTDANGNYRFTDVRSGSYTIAPVLTPSLSGMGFTPVSTNVTVGTGNLTNINFIGMFSISGRVATSAGAAIQNVLVRLSTPASSTTVLTDASGNYKFSNVRSGSYTISASQTGKSFSPASRSVTVNTLSLTNQSFTGSG